MNVKTKIVVVALVFAVTLGNCSPANANAKPLLPRVDGQFDFGVTVQTSPVVIFGNRIPFYFKTKKKMNASCSIYRWEADSAWTHTYIGSSRLVKGKGKGSVTWEWDSQEVNPILNLQVFCKSGNLFGAGYKAVTGAWGTDQ
jgi:hypothetical protein